MSDLHDFELTPEMVAEINARRAAKDAKTRGNGRRMPHSRTAFVKVPVPWCFIAARRLKDPAMATLLAVLYAMRFGDRSVSLSEKAVKQFRIDRDGLRRGLRALEKAGLARVERNGSAAPKVTPLNASWPALPDQLRDRLAELGKQRRFWWPGELLDELVGGEGWPQSEAALIDLLRAAGPGMVTRRRNGRVIDLAGTA